MAGSLCGTGKYARLPLRDGRPSKPSMLRGAGGGSGAVECRRTPPARSSPGGGSAHSPSGGVAASGDALAELRECGECVRRASMRTDEVGVEDVGKGGRLASDCCGDAETGELAAEGQDGMPCNKSWHPSHTRASSTTGDAGEAKSVMGWPRGGWNMSRRDVSSREVVLDECAAQNTPPHLRQWCLRSNSEKTVSQFHTSHCRASLSLCGGGSISHMLCREHTDLP